MVAVSAMAVIAGCGGSSGSGYTASAKASFLRGCESGSNASVCTCMLQYFEAHVSASKLIAATKHGTPGNPPKLFLTAARSCANQQATTT